MKNIYEIPYGYRVIINRSEVRFQAFFQFGDDKAAALQRAIAERDNFFAIHGSGGISGQRPRSNTGISGLSEVTKWFHNQPYNCFQVTVGKSNTNPPVRFHYRGTSGRLVAFHKALAYRVKQTGEDKTALIAQAREALCV